MNVFEISCVDCEKCMNDVNETEYSAEIITFCQWMPDIGTSANQLECFRKQDDHQSCRVMYGNIFNPTLCACTNFYIQAREKKRRFIFFAEN